MTNVWNRMPKLDLHLHLDGCVKPGTMLDWAREARVRLPADDAAGLLPYMQADADCRSLVEYLAKFSFVLPFMQSAEALERAAYEVVERAAADNCLYIEVRFAPLLHVSRGLTAEAAIAAVIRGLKLGERRFGVMARAIAIAMRHQSPESGLDVVQAAARHYGHGLVAVDLAGDEANFPPAPFRGTFALARELGLPVTIHAGEAGGADNVARSIEQLGATRIGHGVRARENPQVLELLKERRIALELCPTSNLQTKAVAGWADYPLRDYYDYGLMLTINTDNPTVSGTSMSEECRSVAEYCGFTPVEIAGLMANAVEASFLDEQDKNALRSRFETELENSAIAIAGEM